MAMEGVSVRAEDKRDVKRFSVRKRLLYSSADSVVIILGFDDRDRKVRFEGENVVRPSAFSSAPSLSLPRTSF